MRENQPLTVESAAILVVLGCAAPSVVLAQNEVPPEKFAAVAQAFEKDSRSKQTKYPEFRLRMLSIANRESAKSEKRRAWVWLYRNSWWERIDGTMYTSAQAAAKQLLWNHMDSTELDAIVRYRYVLGREDRTRALRKIMKFSPHEALKGLACFGLGRDRVFSKDKVVRIEGEKYLERVVKRFARIPHFRTTLGDMASAALHAHGTAALGVGQVAPEIRGVDQEGREVSTKDYEGKILVVVFWELRCKPCRAAYALGDELRGIAGDRCAILGITGAPNPETVRDAMSKKLFKWPSILDGGLLRGPITTRWRVNRWPTAVVIDASGRIQAKPKNLALVPQIVDALAKDGAKEKLKKGKQGVGKRD